MESIRTIVNRVIKDAFGVDYEVELSRPDPKFGDYATNASLKLAEQLKSQPREIAEKLAVKLRQNEKFAEVTIAGPGFINLRLTDETLSSMIQTEAQPVLDGQSVVIETNNPNPFKDLHIGHAYNCIAAGTIANLLELGRANVHRVSYHGDIGLHVGKSMWAILRYIDGDKAKLVNLASGERPVFLSRMYVEGSKAYVDDEIAKKEIEELAVQSFELDDPFFKEIYEICRDWSFQYLGEVLKRLGDKPTESQYLESQADSIGVETVKQHIGDVFEESNGAIIFPGERYALHTRVFLSSRGAGLYEARDLGLMQLKNQDFHPAKSYIITGEEQRDYFNVVIKAAELCLPDLKDVTVNIPTGTVKLSTGKMSSRTGEVINIEWLFEKLKEAAKSRSETVNPEVILGALRYALLKVRIGGDIVFDIEESISIEGNSGPYLQYAHARARSILSKKQSTGPESSSNLSFDASERSLVLKMTEYQEVLDRAVRELRPHHICNYLYELAQEFNRFYEHNRVIDDEREATRLRLVSEYAEILRAGLGLLGIPAPERI